MVKHFWGQQTPSLGGLETMVTDLGVSYQIWAEYSGLSILTVLTQLHASDGRQPDLE